MAILSSVPCPVDGCAVHLRVTAASATWDPASPNEMIVAVSVDDTGRAHLASHLAPEPSPP